MHFSEGERRNGPCPCLCESYGNDLTVKVIKEEFQNLLLNVDGTTADGCHEDIRMPHCVCCFQIRAPENDRPTEKSEWSFTGGDGCSRWIKEG